MWQCVILYILNVYSDTVLRVQEQVDFGTSLYKINGNSFIEYPNVEKCTQKSYNTHPVDNVIGDC